MSLKFQRFSPPVLNSNVIERHVVTKQINDLSVRGILFIHAPAGYGKTTAAALWSRGKNTVWITLDEFSTSPADVYKCILFTLSCEIPDDFENAPLKCTLSVLQDLKKWPDAIIIDNFHLCFDPKAAKALPLIRARIPISTSFIILSRNPPTDVLNEQIFKGDIRQLTALNFTKDEIALLFKKNEIPISNYDTEQLHKQTGGWVGALVAILMSQAKSFSGILDREILNHYFKSHVFEDENKYRILKKCSVCDTLNPKLCEAITGHSDAWNIILALANKTGLISKFDKNTYRFHDLLKDFLFSELQLDENIDKPSLYKITANWYEANGSIHNAVVLAAKSGDIPLIEHYMRLSITEYGKFNTDIMVQSLAIIENVYSIIPDYIAEKSLSISLTYFSVLYNSGRLLESLEWLDKAKGLLENHEYPRDAIIRASILFALDPRERIHDIIFKSIIPVLTSSQTGSKTVMVFSTLNLPFFHKAHIDFTGISPNLDGVLSKAVKPILRFMFPALKLSLLLIEAGIRYECGELDKAEKIAEEAVRISGQFPPNMQFCSLTLYTEILRVQGKDFDMARIGNIIINTKSYYLSPNFNAYTATVQLQTGDLTTAVNWLARTDMENTLNLYKIYQFFTTSRALIMTGKLSEAEALLERLAVFSQDYRRDSDYIEALALQAICKWHMKRADDAVKTIIRAIMKAAELQIVMPIAKEGHDILPILQKVLNRLKRGYDTGILNKAFVNVLFLKAHTISQYSSGMFSRIKDKPVKLSPRQMEILDYLGQNLTYREISDITGVTFTTVNDHIRKIYEKLEVTNARDAVKKAGEMGIGNFPY